MTEPTTGPPRRDPLDDLTIAELDSGSRLLHTDLVHAITTPGDRHRWGALAVVAYLRARREDPRAEVGRFRRMTARELSAELGLDGPAPAERGGSSSDDADPAGDAPTGEGPAGGAGVDRPGRGVSGTATADTRGATDELTADPTGPGPAPSSRVPGV